MKKFYSFLFLLAFMLIFFAQVAKSQNVFFEGFESGNTQGTAITGWTQEAVAGANLWIANTSLTGSNRTPRSGSWNTYLLSSNTRWMFKSVTLTGGQLYSLSFFARQDYTSGTNIRADYGTTGSAAGMTYPIIALTAVTNGSYQLFSGSFTPASSGTYYIGIRADLTNYPWCISIDDISLDGVTPLTGTKTIDPAGSGVNNYLTFTSAINDLNYNGAGTGGVTFNVKDGATFTENPPAITATGASGNNIVFQRDNSTGTKPVINPTGTGGTSDAGIILSGGDYITFDGIDITINSGNALEYGYLIRNANAINGAQYNTIKNAKITLNRANLTSVGIMQSASSSYGEAINPANNTGANSNNKYYNNTIENSYSGIWLFGSTTYYDASCEIGSTSGTNWTTIGASSANDIGNGSSFVYGIHLNYQKDYSVFNTEIRNCTGTGSSGIAGIYANYGTGTASIYNCKVHDIQSTYTLTGPIVYGINIYQYTSTSLTTNIYNNIVYALNHGRTAPDATMLIYGIYMNNAGTANLYYNSIRIDEDANPTSAAYYSYGSMITVKNNIFANYSTVGATSKRYCLYYSQSGITSSNNILYIASGTNNFVGYGLITDRATLEQFAGAISGTAPVIGNEAGSANFDPSFTSTSDLTLVNSSPAVNSGTPITGITKDIAGTDRDATRPNIGAYESAVTQTDKSGPVFSNYTLTGNNTSSLSISIDLKDNSNSGSNATVQLWYRTGSSGAYTGIDADSKPAGMNGTYTWSNSVLPFGTNEFYIAARDGQGAGSGIWVYPMWKITWTSWAATDPPNFTGNPDAAANIIRYTKKNTLAGGTYEVGDNQSTLKKLTDVANQLNGAELTGNVTYELNSTYDGATGETFPITFNQFATTGGDWTVTVRVKSGAGARATSGNNNGSLIDFNGIDRLTFDGREGGAGSTKTWTITNSSTGISSSTISLKNDATYNTVKYCELRGANTYYYFGVVYFYHARLTGNDYNTIDNCNIKNAASDEITNMPACGIYSEGQTNNAANDNNTISNCNIFNFWNAGTDSYGIRIRSYNDAWTISGNSFYQGSTRTPSAGNTHYGIHINNTSGNNFTVSGNYIGGGAVSCGGTAWTVAGGFPSKFQAIYLNVGTTTASSVQGNTINNFDFATISGSIIGAGSFCGINIAAGNVNIGNTAANIIGSATVDKIKLTSSTAALLVGINSESDDTVNISGNTIYGLTIVGSTAATDAYLTGIKTSGSTSNYTINSNIIGSTSVANSMRAGISATTTGATFTTGILNSATGRISISQNTLGNLASFGVNTATTIKGVSTSEGRNTITQNTLRDIYTPSSNTGTGSLSSVIGISMTADTAGQVVSQNTIFGLSNSHGTAAVCLTGIHYAGPTTGTNLIARNLIYGLSIVSTSATADMRGLNFAGGLANVQNNMIALGTGLTTGIQITGLCDTLISSNTGMYFNSIYIGGTGSSGTGAGNTYAFRSGQTSRTRTYQNNIFVNARSNGTTTGKHYAVRVNGVGVPVPPGLNLNYNIYQASGSGSVFGYYNAADVSSLISWRGNTGQDMNSGYGNPNFRDPTAGTPDLRVQGTTPAEGSGLNIPAVTDDYEGHTRSDLTPVDIGADAGNYTASDIFPPIISYTALGNGTTANRVLTNFAIITDNVGLSSGVNAPRLYYKKSTDNNAFVGNTSGDIGWKYVVGTGSSPYSFTIDYSIIYGGSVAIGNTIQYFVVAQDDANNLGSLPGGATASGNPPVQNINGKATSPDSYNITTTYSGTYNVPGSYATLTGAGGLFATLNSGVVSGNIIVNITSDITEDGANALNQCSEDGLGGYTLTIQPDAAATRTLSGNYAGGLIRLDGADRVTINGNYGGTGQYLTFSNTNVSENNYTISLTNNANNNNFKNCKIYSKNEAMNITNADNTLIEGNDIYGDVAGNANYFQAGIYLTTGSINTKIRRNSIHDFYNTVLSATGCFGIRFASDATSVTEISNNAIYNIKSAGSEDASHLYYAPAGISIESGGNIQIYNNSIYMSGTTLGYSHSISCGSAIQIHSAATSLDIRNNVLRNSMLNKLAAICNIYVIRSLSGTSAFSNLDYNDYYVTTGDNTNTYIGFFQYDQYSTLAEWKTATGKDANSVSADPGFTSTTNLQPNVTDINCWNINSGAYPLASVSTDILGVTRSTTLEGGATDIGAYEFTPNTGSNYAPVSIGGTITNGGTSTVTYGGVTIASIAWSSVLEATLPDNITVTYKPGVNPPNTLPGSKFANEIIEITADGGSGYTYDLTLKYNLSRQGTITSEANYRLAKYNGVSWLQYPALPNQTNKTITVTGLNSFSIFSFGDNDSPLPVQLASFTSLINGRDVRLTWKTEAEINNAGFDVERSVSGSNQWLKAGYVVGKGTVNKPTIYTFEDKKLDAGKINYRLKQIDNNGNFTYFNLSNTVEVGIPTKFDLSQNYPNPFNPVTKIDFSLPLDSKVSIKLYDITGREVKTLVNDSRTAGYYTVQFNASDLSSGTYFYRIMTKSSSVDYIMTKKMVIIK